MRRFALLLPLLLLVAFELTAPITTGSAATEMTFKERVLVSANDDQAAGEPSIRSAPDGTLYIVAPSGLGNVRTDNESGGGDIIWRSDDGGKTWKFLGSLDNQQGGGDADVAPDQAGVVWGAGLTLANTTAAISTDRGENFNVNPISSLSTVVDRQWIETYRSEPFAFLTTGQFNGSIILSRLERAPNDYPVVSNTVTVSGEDAYQWPGEIAVDEVDEEGLVYVGYNTAGGNKDDIKVARTDLQLANLQLAKVTTTKGDTFDSFVAVDVDKAGNVYAVWTERRPRKIKKFGRTNTYLSVSRDRGQSWTAPTRLNVRARTTTFPWVVAGSKGRVAVAYYGINHRGASPEKVVYPGRRIPKWKVWVSYSLNADSSSPTYVEKRATGPLHAGNVCTSGTGCDSGTRDLLDFFQLDLNPCGKIVITYTDNSRDVVTKDGTRSKNEPELVAFVKQAAGPRFYTASPPEGARC